MMLIPLLSWLYNLLVWFLNQMQVDHRLMHAWFLEIIMVCMSVCVCVYVCLSVCLSVPEGLNQWCDIDRVWLVKQVLWLFPAFSCFIWHLLSIKWMSLVLAQHIVNICQGRLRWCATSYRKTTLKKKHLS